MHLPCQVCRKYEHWEKCHREVESLNTLAWLFKTATYLLNLLNRRSTLLDESHYYFIEKKGTVRFNTAFVSSPSSQTFISRSYPFKLLLDDLVPYSPAKYVELHILHTFLVKSKVIP